MFTLVDVDEHVRVCAHAFVWVYIYVAILNSTLYSFSHLYSELKAFQNILAYGNT